MAVFDWNFLRYAYNFKNLPSNNIAPDGQGIYTVSYSFFSADTEIRTIDWGSDANYYSDTSNDHLVNNYDTLTEEIKDAVKIILKHQDVTPDNSPAR